MARPRTAVASLVALALVLAGNFPDLATAQAAVTPCVVSGELTFGPKPATGRRAAVLTAQTTPSSFGACTGLGALNLLLSGVGTVRTFGRCDRPAYTSIAGLDLSVEVRDAESPELVINRLRWRQGSGVPFPGPTPIIGSVYGHAPAYDELIYRFVLYTRIGGRCPPKGSTHTEVQLVPVTP